MGSVARRFKALNRRLFRRVGRGEIRSALERIGLARGDTVWARISMRSLGYVSGGPQEVIEAIRDVIGEAGTLVTAAWPFAEPYQAERSKLFDVAETPSAAGLLSETLRRLPGACRSLHPIASVVAIGEAAEALTRGHEMARTPFGDESPYGRLASSAPRLLLVGAHLGGILYHVQDKVGFPNLYAPEPAVFESRDAQRRSRTIRTSVLRPDVAPVIILPGSRPETREYLLVADYALIFPLERERRLMEAGYLRFNRSRFLGRRERLQARGILKLGQVGSAPAALLDGSRLLDQIARDMAWDLARFKDEYDPEQMALIDLPRL